MSDTFPCASIAQSNFGSACFGLYFFEIGQRASHPQSRFTWKTDAYNGMPAGVLVAAARNMVDWNPHPTVARPDIEWTIKDFNALRRSAGFPEVDRNGIVPWEMNIIGFAGSFQDDGVGEDNVPDNGDFVNVKFPCVAFDACDVCGGDDQS